MNRKLLELNSGEKVNISYDVGKYGGVIYSPQMSGEPLTSMFNTSDLTLEQAIQLVQRV